MKRVLTYLRALILGLACVAALAGPAARAESLDHAQDKQALLSPVMKESFPRLKEAFTILGPGTKQYNCIAWSIGNTREWVWPGNRVEDFDRLYAEHGYTRQPGLNLAVEPGKRKLVLYATLNKDATINAVTHAAVQEADGSWTSKLGQMALIRHATPEALRGRSYGTPVAVYVCPIK
jgi:hypothetical protein